MRTPIDAFIVSALESRGLELSPEADRATLIRRASLDLLGLPPSPQEIDDFIADTSPAAYERLIERLLASPRYGERWARHWLDVVRFGESNGYETNTARPNAWPYRDWLIGALNDDIPYRQFVLEQLAGEQVGADAATGFLVGGAHDVVGSPDIELTRAQRMNDLDDMISTTAAAFLGLTVGWRGATTISSIRSRSGITTRCKPSSPGYSTASASFAAATGSSDADNATSCNGN